MTRTMMKTLKNLTCLGLLASALYGSQARAQYEVVFPPPDFVATATPEYFEGHPAYYWNGRWFWSDGRGWRAYHDEPAYLRERRFARPPERHFYEGRGPAVVHHEEYRRR